MLLCYKAFNCKKVYLCWHFPIRNSVVDLELSTESFEDLGVSAWTGSNTKEDAGLGQFIHALETNKIKTPCYLLVESLDRLSRANIKVAMNQLWSITDKLTDPMVLQKVSELSEQVRKLDEAIEDLEQGKLSSDNKLQSLAETIQLLDTAFATEDNKANLSARIKLKQLLNATFDYFQMTRVDSDNGKVLY